MIIVSDVHGCYDTLMELMKQFPEGEDVVFVGDLIDRGPKSKEVVEFVKNGGYDCVLGNHEKLMCDGLDEFDMGIYDRNFKIWQENGGVEGLASYQGDSVLLKKHIEYFVSLPLLKTYKFEGHKDLLVTHAPSVNYIDRYFANQNLLSAPWGAMSQLDRDAINMEVDSFCDWMIWYRRVPTRGSERFFGVSGHNVFNLHPDACTKTYAIVNEELGFASIDTGVCFPEEPFGILTAIQYPSLKLFQQPLIDSL